MKRQKLKILLNLFHEFMPLYHKKFSALFHENDGLQPKCNKNQVKTMFILLKNEKITPTDLGNCLDLRKGSLTTLIDSLEEYNFVKRRPDNEDRRKTWLSLTPQGKEYMKKKRQIHEQRFYQTFETMKEEELDEIIKSFQSILDIIAKDIQ